MRTTGILTFALGKGYAVCAAHLFRSARMSGTDVCICVPDTDVASQKTLQDMNVPFVPFKDSGLDKTNKFWFETLAYDLTPFDVTLKMDSDCFIPYGCNLDRYFERTEKSGVLNGSPTDLEGKPVLSSPYRDWETKNGLPEIYSTMFGFIKSEDTKKFFEAVKGVYYNWNSIEKTGTWTCTTDTAYSWAWAQTFTSASALSGLPFHHMKPGTMGWGSNFREDWTKSIPHSVDPTSRVWVGGRRVSLPIHYVDKNFIQSAFAT